MKLEPKPSPRHPELMIYMDGRIYDSVLMKNINLVSIHQYSARGPIALWTTMGKTYSLDVIKLVYETYVSKEMLQTQWMVDFREGKEIKPENLKKTRKYEKDNNKTRPILERTCWMNGNDDIYIW
jgi:hypothetical protein